MKPQVLPVYYYLDHFTEMLDFVKRTYGSVLSHEHHVFIKGFDDLSRDAQCLLVRMVNRRGAIFNRTHFKYPEIVDVEAAVRDLLASGHARALQADDYAAFITCLPKDILVTAAHASGRCDIRKSWSKPKLTDYFLANVPFDVAARHCGGKHFIALRNTQPIEFLLYLYFGKTERDLKSFALRDLGIMRTNSATSFSARFADGDEAHACFHYSRLLDQLETKAEAIYREGVVALLGGPPGPTDYASDLRNRAAFKLGQFFEKGADPALALQLYRAGSSPECRERLVRLHYSRGAKNESEALLRQIIDDPASDEEHFFAVDFYARKFGGQRMGLCTELLRSGQGITVDDTYRGNPEAGVAGVMRRQGAMVYFAENALWHTLFGLLFWDELFESGQLHSGFDWVPHCLKDRTFIRTFKPEVERKLAAVRSGEALPLILRMLAARWGRSNGIFNWDRFQIEAVRALLDHASPHGVAVILQAMCEDFRAMRDGFPDLMLVRDEEVSFLEIKAEGDVIRRNQLTRLRQLQTAGLKAEIGRVEFRFDPGQDYIVVDIETTGSWAAGDRITEIGAVKIRNHQVVDEWHSLLNPQRAIPAQITRLTGITNEMVRHAPVFASVADSFLEFMADGIFVAHNVNFDYGFITYEFSRLDRKFRYPKLCTCAGMRRRYPGHKSYGLGHLCQTYDIELESHHRALCDAKAAGQLLNLINRKRESEGPLAGHQAA
ncbi:conserved hypothetical protein [Bradyrhizobium sp. ORS 375]|uniref:exonuclease n=1 Tax=Bradyrhizobium sp. (strain ORS 375) TaxID=566679 RepID=UPI00024064B9|nr:exonuclease [Bradyrhizobium sp. ORS 375]CCD95916.1 conserved hypothetical protein [Bradyrhizobium sp. ORS 375]